MEQAIVLLKREFEMYFGGGSKKPPVDTQTKLGKDIKKFGLTSGLSYALRFRYNTIVSRFNTYNELWNKQLRMKEEGKYQTGPNAPPEHAPRAHHQEKRPRDPLENVYNDYLATRKKTGEGASPLNYDNFAQLVSKQKEQLISKYRCKDVQFYVAVEDGKTKLKAKPMK